MRQRRRRPIVSTIAGLSLVAAGITPAVGQPEEESSESSPSLTAEYDGSAEASTQSEAVAEAWEGVSSDTGLWIVQFAGPSVAAHKAAAEASGQNVTQSTLDAVDAQLADEHSAFQAAAEDTLARDVEVAFTYRNVLNGMAVRVSETEAEQLRSLPGVVGVYPDVEREMETDVSHEVLQSPAIWGGETGDGTATRGEGVIIGFIDSGVNPWHPSFAEVDGDGYAHENPYGEGVYKGVCAGDDAGPCNDKLVGIYALHPANSTGIDQDDHGSHVGSTIAGSKHTADVSIGGSTFERTLQGVAPRANAISYQVCSPTCPGTSTIAAVNNAITDDVDVLNYSISGGDFPWQDPVDIAFRDAAAAGVNVVASAGNDGPGASTVAKTGPWMASTAATTHHRVFAQPVTVTAPTPVPDVLANMPGFPGEGPSLTEDLSAEIRSAADLGNFRACTALPAGSMEGAIAFVERGDCTFEVKVNNATNAGAVGVLMGNNFGGPPIAPGGLENTTIPTVLIPYTESQALLDFFAATDDEVTGTIGSEADIYFNEDWTDLTAGFSSRGPSQYDMLAPTYAAPGVNILAAAAGTEEDPDRYAVLQGTSMSSPHAAGSTALMRAVYPDRTPTEIRSMLAMSADTEGLTKDDGSTQADPFDIGSGRINLSEASRMALAMDETIPNMIAANPGVGGDPATLNLPAMVDRDCQEVCTWEREVTNVSDVTATFTASVDNPGAAGVSVSPASFELAPGDSQALTITASMSTDTGSTWSFGSVTLATSATHANGNAIADATLPVVLRGVAQADPNIEVDPDQITSTQPEGVVTTHPLTISNTGGGTLTWEFVEGGGEAVLHHQDIGGTSGIVSDYGNNLGHGAYAADDFTLDDTGTLTEIHTPGFWNAGSLTSATDISWRIYADDNGRPASHPEDGDDYVFGFTTTPTGTGVDITDNNITLDLAAATGSTLELDAGTYWLSVYPHINSNPGSTDRWNWYQGTPDLGAPGHLVDPSGIFGSIALDWATLEALVGWRNLAFTITGEGSCGADWVSVDPTSGSTAAGASSQVEVSLDSTGMAEGTYTTTLCLESNDPDTAMVTVPVTMTVEEPEAVPVIDVTPESLSASQAEGVSSEHELTIANEGTADLTWELFEQEAGVQADPSLVLPQGADRASGATEAEGRAPQSVQPTATPMAATELTEGFDDVDTLPGQGWAMQNNSEPVGTISWFQGNAEDVFPAHQGAEDSYIGANFNSAGISPGNINNWLMTPELELTNGSTLSFWTRTAEDSQWADRLEVRMSTEGASTDVGTGYNGTGDFTTRLLVINEDLQGSGYPQTWTNFEVTVEGLDEPTTGRLAFRYHVPNGGPVGANSNYIGIDTLTYTAAEAEEPPVCEPVTDIPWMSAEPTSGTTGPGGSTPVTVTLDSTGLEIGTHEAQLCVQSNDRVNPIVVVPVTLEVTETPEDPVDVERWAGEDRYGTAVEVSKQYAPGQDVVFVATGQDYPDALTGAAIAGSWDAPLLLTQQGLLPSVVVDELERLDPTKVVVLGGDPAISEEVERQIGTVTGATMERWFGDDRYGTAAAVSEAFDNGQRVFIATGADYPDALVASARAGAVDSPVLLVKPGSIPRVTRQALDAIDPAEITVMGGDDAVDDTVLAELEGWGEVTRIDGETRYQTAALLMEEYDSAERVYVASGQNWPDALVGGAKAASDEQPLLLTKVDMVPESTKEALLRLWPDSIVLFGGYTVINEEVETELGNLRDWE